MTVTQRTGFTPGRETDLTPFVDKLIRGWHAYQDTAPYSVSFVKRQAVARARENDRDSRMPLTIVWKHLDGFEMERLERVRNFHRQVALDSLAEMVGVRRGAALTAKPDRALRAKIELFKDIQATREAAFEFTGKGKYGGKDVPLRAGLGGWQDFTPWP